MDFVQIGRYIADIRGKKKISQEQMAKDLNISRATISNFENGKATDIGLKKVLSMVDYLGYDIDIKERSVFPVFEELVGG
jgi:transcriptional regulator with XRE-family HTH domain